MSAPNKFTSLLIVNGLSNLGHFSAYPLIGIYLINILHISFKDTAILLLYFSISLRITRVFLSPLVDRVGLKPSLIISLFSCFLGYWLLACLSSTQMIMVAMLFIGAGYGTSMLTIKIYTSLDKEKSTIVHYTGLNVITNLAAISAPFLGNIVLTNFPHGGLCIFSGGIFLIGCIVTFFLPLKSETLSTQKNWLELIVKQFVSHESLCPHIITFLSWFLLSQFFSFIPLYLTNGLISQNMLGAVYIANGIVIILLSSFVSYLLQSKKISFSTQVNLFFSIFSSGFVLLFIYHNLIVFFIVIILWSIAEIIITPLLSVLTAKSVSPELRTAGFSANAIAMGLGEGIGNFISISLANTANWSISLGLLSVLGLVFLLICSSTRIKTQLKLLGEKS